MLGTIGFVATGILFGAFALTINRLASKSSSARFGRFSLAYLLLAIAFLGYGLAAATGTGSMLNISVLFGNVVILLATLLILNIMLEGQKSRRTWLIVAAALSVGMVVLRATRYYPTPAIEESILVFHSPKFVSFILSSIFMLVWLPVNLRISRQILAEAKIRELNNIYPAAYGVATLSAVIFLLSKRPHALIPSFAAISLSFVALIITNMFIKYIKDSHGK